MKKTLLNFIFAVSVVSLFSVKVFAVDVYITYMGGDKEIKKPITAALPADLKVKYYNASALAMADYSGRQKAMAKISQAKLVVVVKATTMEVLESPAFANHIIVESSDASELDKIKTKL